MRSIAGFGACFGVALALAALPGIEAARADPPPWAPAHGWRAKHQKQDHSPYIDDDGDDDDRYDRRPAVIYQNPPSGYGVPSAIADRSCNRDMLGGLLGGSVGNDMLGGALGGIVGGLVGNQFGKGNGNIAATIGGVLVGALVGGSVGRSMDTVDQACAQQVLEQVPDRQSIGWDNPNGARYAMVPTRTYQSDGRYCREYRTRATVDGHKETMTGTACRLPDGSWQIVN